MIVIDPGSVDFAESWQQDDETARWRSGPGHGASSSGSSLLEVEPGHRLPLHTDSAEETIVVVSGTADVRIAGERSEVLDGGLAVVPKLVPHEVRNVGSEPLRFVAVYADQDVVTRYEHPVLPDGSPERHTVRGSRIE
jgi:mannose-6-phosphate isomerase-like protein (cupin superfamily)